MRLAKERFDRLWQLVEPVVEELCFELVDIVFRQEGNRNILDITVDKENGITVDDCAVVSEKVSLLLDVEDLIQHKYYLEVGSPGLFRELKNDRDLARNIGKRVKASFKSPVKGQKHFTGLLAGYRERRLAFSNETQEFVVDQANIKTIRLNPDI